MSAGSSLAEEQQARAWFLLAQFDVAVHTRLANSATDQIFPEYVRELLDARKKYRETRLKGLVLFTYSMPTSLSCLSSKPDGNDEGIVVMQGILHGPRLVLLHAVQGLFGSVQGLTTHWAPLCFGQGQAYPSLNEHAAFKTFLRESSLGGLDPTLMFRVDYIGKSEARQLVIHKDDERAKAWKFEAVIDVTHHTDLVAARGEDLWEYFRLHILERNPDWEIKNAKFDLFSYSVPRNICNEHGICSRFPVTGYLRHGSRAMRRREVQGMLDGIPGLTVNWSAVHTGSGGSLASNAEYKMFLEKSTKDSLNPDTNLRIRVDVSERTDAPAKKRGCVPGSRPRTALVPLDSLINSVGALDTLPTLRLLDDSAAKRPKPSAARAPPAPSLLAATPAAAPTPAIRAQVRNSPPRPPAPRARAAAPHAARAPAPAPRRAGAAPFLPHYPLPPFLSPFPLHSAPSPLHSRSPLVRASLPPACPTPSALSRSPAHPRQPRRARLRPPGGRPSPPASPHYLPPPPPPLSPSPPASCPLWRAPARA